MIDRMSRRVLQFGFVFVCAVLMASCYAPEDGVYLENPKEFEILIHPDAMEVMRFYNLTTGNSGEFRNWQANYTVNLTYPEMAVDEGRRNALYELGWMNCKDRFETWQVFVQKLQDNSRRCVYQDLSYLAKGKSLVSIVLSYTGQISENSTCPKTPTNTLQTVIVHISDDQDVEKEIKRLGLTCGQK